MSTDTRDTLSKSFDSSARRFTLLLTDIGFLVGACDLPLSDETIRAASSEEMPCF